MKFTYDAYRNMINLLKENNYSFTDYKNYTNFKKVVILRHDIDMSLERALKLAKLENQLGVSGYYFVLLSTDFYNVNSKKSLNILNQIKNLGGKIGLHFDEVKYKLKSKEDYIKYVTYEIELLTKILGFKVDVVSMHRPSKDFLELDLEIPNVVNSYQKKFFNEFKYISDSRMQWRENAEEVIDSDKYKQLHILTHAFWYTDKEETLKDKLENFLKESVLDRYDNIDDNFRDLKSVIPKEVLNEYK